MTEGRLHQADPWAPRGVKLTAEAGVVIAKAATEANFTLSLEWSAAKLPPADPAAPTDPAEPTSSA